MSSFRMSGARAGRLARTDPRGSKKMEGQPRRLPLPWPSALSAGHMHVHLVEVDDDVTRRVRAQMGRLVGNEVRAVAGGQVEGVGEVLNVVLVVERLSEPGRKVAATGNATGSIGREGEWSFVGACHPELVAHRKEGDVEDLVRRCRGDRARSARTRR